MVPFDHILEAIQEGSADAGLVIHEAQLTYGRAGYHNVVDLGRWWKDTYDLPLPLGANVLRRDLQPGCGQRSCRLMRESIQYALDHREEALNYAMQFARDMDPALAEKFVGMYVNHYTVDCGELVPKAAQKLLDMGLRGWTDPAPRSASSLCGETLNTSFSFRDSDVCAGSRSRTAQDAKTYQAARPRRARHGGSKARTRSPTSLPTCATSI